MLRWLWRAVLALTVLILAGAGLASWRFAQYAPPDPPTAPDAQALARFIDDYAPARQAFLAKGDALEQRFARVQRFAIPVASARGVTGSSIGEDFPEVETQDLIVSGFALHRVNDLPGYLTRLRRALKPDGLLIAAFAGGDTLHELRASLLAAESEVRGSAGLRVFPMVDVRAAGQLLQRAGLALPVADADKLTVRYDNVFALIGDLRAMGATASALLRPGQPPLTRTIIARAAQIYAERFADADGRIRATFEIIWISGWAPHESQQKPLKPGSAKTPLADALAKIREEKE